jgi:hypothetical protein
MKLTESYAQNLAGTLSGRLKATRESTNCLWRLIDPECRGAGNEIPYPPDAGWLNALEQSATIAVIEAGALLDTLRVIQERLSRMEAEK